METLHAEYTVGQVIHHKLFGYRGVIVDVDPFYRGDESVYGKLDTAMPPKNKPWYHVLVDNDDTQTYVCEVNLEEGDIDWPIEHPMLDVYLGLTDEGKFRSKIAFN